MRREHTPVIVTLIGHFDLPVWGEEDRWFVGYQKQPPMATRPVLVVEDLSLTPDDFEFDLPKNWNL